MTIIDQIKKAVDLVNECAVTGNADNYEILKTTLVQLHEDMYVAEKAELVEAKDYMSDAIEKASNPMVSQLLAGEIEYADAVIADIYGL